MLKDCEPLSPIGQSDLDWFLRFESVWLRFTGASIFVTGGSGFFGSWLIEALVYANRIYNLNLRVATLTRNAERFVRRFPYLAQEPALTILQGDVSSELKLAGRFQYILHLATETRPSFEAVPPLTLFNANIAATHHLIAFAQKCEAKRVLFTSSGAVYGPQPAGIERMPENGPCMLSPNLLSSAYGESKRASEFMLSAAGAQSVGTAFVTARCFAFVGPRLPLDANYAIGNFIRDALSKRPITISGDGTPLRSYLYSADLVIWLLTLLLEGRSGESYNVGSEQAVSIEQLAYTVREALRVNIEINTLQMPCADRAPNRYIPDTAKARALGLSENFSLIDCIRRTANYHSSLND